MYLTERGILFLAQDTSKTIYLPFCSIAGFIVIVMKDLASARKDTSKGKKKNKHEEAPAVEISLMFQATEPWYDEEADSASKDQKTKKGGGKDIHTIISTQISLDSLNVTEGYARIHEQKDKLKYQLCQIMFCDHAAGQPTSGLEPLTED